MTKPDTKTVTRRAAAEIIGIAPATLKKWMGHRGPRVAAKLGTTQQARTLYSLAEIQKWQRDPAAYERRHRDPSHDRRHNAGK
jgi:predicted secreted Zn-dependent protease